MKSIMRRHENEYKKKKHKYKVSSDIVVAGGI
jgi:hypothetical protein